ncbi:MAG: histidine phosphatase family protein [Eubacterium sp.]|nr:histidine phosphatase family protein [Eubacterium sp.]
MRNRTDDQVMLAFIRHGATKANEERRYLGKTDEGLSKQGIKELMAQKRRGIYPQIENLFTSPMKRCLQTAQILYPNLQPMVIPEWSETDFGRFEYRNYEDLKDDSEYQTWIDSGGRLPFPEGEGREKFLARCKKGFARMCGELRMGEAAVTELSMVARIFVTENRTTRAKREVMEERHALAGIIVHGGTIMALLGEYCGNGYYDYQVQNGEGFLCSMKGWKRV